MNYIFKRLISYQRSQVLNHFLRLDLENRYNRFCNPATDEFIATYVNKIDFTNGIFGVYDDKLNIIGLGECIFYPNSTSEVEIAFSVEKEFQNKGIGNQLMRRVIQFAHSKNVEKLYMHCLKHNVKTQHLAQKHGIKITFDKMENIGTLDHDQLQVIAACFQENIEEFLASTRLNIKNF